MKELISLTTHPLELHLIYYIVNSSKQYITKFGVASVAVDGLNKLPADRLKSAE